LKRSQLNVYDEAGFLSEEYCLVTEAFCTQNASFKMGKGIDNGTIPKMLPNQILYCSSASSTDTHFFSMYKNCAKEMLMGNPSYFVADISCDMVIGATNHGKNLAVPLLTQDKVDHAMKANPEKARREYYNKFTTEGGNDYPFKRSVIMRNSAIRPPMLINEGNEKRRIIMAYDPARTNDNSIVGVAELIEDEVLGTKLRIQNFVSLVDIGLKNKTPMRSPEQTAYIKKMILDYNGEGYADYENLEILMVDAGAGGGGTIIPDYFMEDWEDANGIKHKGIIDPQYSEEYLHRFPNASEKLWVVDPRKYRTEMFDKAIEMINLGLVEFTSEFDETKDYIMIPEEKDGEVVYHKHTLAFEEALALKNIDLAKEEAYMMQRVDNPTNTGHTYQYPPEKRKYHDDRCFVLALLCFYLANVRQGQIRNKPDKKKDISKLLQFRAPTRNSRI